MAQVTKASAINLSNIKFSDPRKVGNNGVHVVYVNYGGGINPLYVQSPKVDIKWNPTYYADNEEQGKYTVEIALPGVGSDDQITPFHNKMAEFDQFMLDTAYENRAAWFKNGKKLSRDTIETVYTPMIKVSVDSETGEPDGKWPPSFKFKIKKTNSKFTCNVFDSAKNQLNIDNKESDDFVDLETILVKGNTVNLILKCVSVWLINGKFGVTWQAEQMMVTTKPSVSLNGCAFVDDDDDAVPSNDVVSNVVADSDDEYTEANDGKEPNKVEDSDDDDSDDDSDDDDVEEEPAPEPEPEPVKKKKVVRRVKKSE